jgi:putative membrane protein
MAYGAIAGLMLVSGLVRIYAEKGAEYYTGNPWFWTKMMLFALAGIISIYPTVSFLRTKTDTLPMFKTIRLCLQAQLVLISAIVLCAVMMARG